jgi:hypothetical protein
MPFILDYRDVFPITSSLIALFNPNGFDKALDSKGREHCFDPNRKAFD